MNIKLDEMQVLKLQVMCNKYNEINDKDYTIEDFLNLLLVECFYSNFIEYMD